MHTICIPSSSAFHCASQTRLAKRCAVGVSKTALFAPTHQLLRQGADKLCVSAVAEPLVEQDRAARSNGTVQPDEYTEDTTKRFQWTKAWYPVACASDMWPDKVNPITLLGHKMVVWKDAEGNWRASEDLCPHRLAALSEGTVADGNIMCKYHGWQFNGEGKCVRIPQAESVTAEQRACNDKASLHTYPCQEKQGLLWIWPETGADAHLEALVAQPYTFSEMDDPAWLNSTGSFGFQENPLGFVLMAENSMDPAHAPFVHDGLVGTMADNAPIHMSVEREVDPLTGFVVKHTGYTKQQHAQGMVAERVFIPPCTIQTIYTYDSGRQDVTALYFCPVKPGVTRSFLKFVFKPDAVPPKPQPETGDGTVGKKDKAKKGGQPPFNVFALLGKLPQGLIHALSHKLMDQDIAMLSQQEVLFSESRDRSHKDYYRATTSDVGVRTFWKWLETGGGGDVAWKGGASSFDLGPPKSRAALMDHYERHTKHCRECQKTVKQIDTGRTVLAAASFVSLALAVVLATMKGPEVPLWGQALLLTLAAGSLAGRAGLAKLRRIFFTSLPEEETLS